MRLSLKEKLRPDSSDCLNLSHRKNKNGVRHHFLFFRCHQRYLARFLKITSFQVWITEAAMMRPATPNNVLPTQMGMSENNDTENMQMKTHRNASKRSFWPGVISTTLRDFLPTKLDASSQGPPAEAAVPPPNDPFDQKEKSPRTPPPKVATPTPPKEYATSPRARVPL